MRIHQLLNLLPGGKRVNKNCFQGNYFTDGSLFLKCVFGYCWN
ncbi:MAG: hypothetical protein RIQ89_382 [Bacteroidota bacterium]|jgi:hypothetical protein